MLKACGKSLANTNISERETTMKKILSIALAVVMVLAVASVASAFNWSKPASSTTADNFGYSIDVMKFTRSTGALGSSSFTADDAATAVNGADVYFTIKLTVNNPDEAIENVAQIKVNFTALQGMTNFTSSTLVGLENGVYYFVRQMALTISGLSMLQWPYSCYRHQLPGHRYR